MQLRSVKQNGFTIPELSVVMFLTVLITGVLVLFYAQARLELERGASGTELQQRTRLTAIRIIPKIASVIRTDPDPDHPIPEYRGGINPIAWPLPADDDTSDPQADAGSHVIVLSTTKEFIETQMRQPITHPFNPRWNGDPATDPYGLLRIKFVELDESEWPEFQDIYGNTVKIKVGEVRMDVYDGAPIPRNLSSPNEDFGSDPADDLLDGDDLSDDIVIATNVSDVSFLTYGDNRRIRLRVVASGTVPNATSGRSLVTNVYETDIYLPVYTNTSGGAL